MMRMTYTSFLALALAFALSACEAKLTEDTPDSAPETKAESAPEARDENPGAAKGLVTSNTKIYFLGFT